jgi:antitoxin YefM
MTHVSYTELRSNLSNLMDRVCDSRAPLLVTRQNARSGLHPVWLTPA